MSQPPTTTDLVVPENRLQQVNTALETAFRSQQPQSARAARLAAFTPANLTEAIALAKMIARSDLVPKEYKNKPDNVIIAMQYAAELGVPPILAIQNIAVINGHASLYGDLFLAVIQSSPFYEWHNEAKFGTPYQEDYGWVCIMKRKGSEPHTVRFSVADAKRAHLWEKRGYDNKETPWITNPDRMLQMRARGFAGRDKFADALKGLIIAEEAMDMPVDTSDAKRKRDEATFDVQSSATIIDMKPSTEPNRGHEATGLEKVKKQEDWTCAECSGVNEHKAGCKYLAEEQQDKKTSKGTIKAAYLILAVIKATKKENNQPYLKIQVVGPDHRAGKLYVWHESFFDHLVGKSDLPLLCEVSEQQGKQGKFYFNLEHILELGGVKFVNDKPVEALGELGTQAKSEGEENF